MGTKTLIAPPSAFANSGAISEANLQLLLQIGTRLSSTHHLGDLLSFVMEAANITIQACSSFKKVLMLRMQ